MVEIPEEVWTRPLEIKQSYRLVHKEKAETSVLVINEEGVPWHYDIKKFFKLGYIRMVPTRKSIVQLG